MESGKQRTPRECLSCGATFCPQREWQNYCCAKCRQAAYMKRIFARIKDNNGNEE